MRRITFLDIDGVLNNSKTTDTIIKEHNTLWVVDSDNTAALNNLVEKSDTEIVISSSWRFPLKIDEIVRELTRFGFRFGDRVVGATPKHLTDPSIIHMATNGIGLKLSMYIPRAWEIHEWLEHNPPVTAFVVLDDMPIVGSGNRHPVLKEINKRLVKTDPDTGLTDRDVKRALRHLMC